MKGVVALHFSLLFAFVAGLIIPRAVAVPPWFASVALPLDCAMLGGIGGIVYCLRAVYINVCVRKSWDDVWRTWHYIRPFVSAVCGGVSYVFLRAGLLVLESRSSPESSNIGFMALAFVAGLNVDRFVGKIEEVAQATWGIEKSRAAKKDDRNAD